MIPRSITGPRILVAWEHGSNMGHLVRLSEIAHSIRARAGTVVWAIPPQHLGHPLVAGHGEPIHVAPSLARPAIQGVAGIQQDAAKRLLSFADVLLVLGFRDERVVEMAVSRWLKLFDVVQPASVLCDYAPFAALAACIAGIPVTQISNGFDAPPADFPLFDSTVRGPYLERVNVHKIEQLAQTVNRVGRALGGADLHLGDFVAWPSLVIDGLPETDPYGARSKANYIGPFALSAGTQAPSWPEGGAAAEGGKSKRVFVYLRGKETALVLEALQSLGLDTCCLWPDAPEEALKRFSTKTTRITREPQNLQMALDQADAVINYGSSGVLNATLLAGKPQLMLPTDMEKLMFSRRVERRGAGLSWNAGKGSLRWAIDWVLNYPSLTATAQHIASLHGQGQLDHQRGVFLDRLMRGAQEVQRVFNHYGAREQ